jgi:probable phosphoglycerate mutase
LAVNVYFVRHGQTYLNLFHKYQGWSDAPLTEKGIEDGKRVGKALAKIDFDYLFCS